MKPKNRIQFGDNKIVKIAPKTHRTDIAREEETKKAAARKQADFKAAGRAYLAFKRAYVSTPCPPSEIPGRMMALRDELSKKIKSRRIKAFFNEQVDLSIEKAVLVYGSEELKRQWFEGGKK